MVYQLIDEDYTQPQYRLGELIISRLLKSLQLRLDDYTSPLDDRHS